VSVLRLLEEPILMILSRLPDNDQIDRAMEYAVNTSPVDVKKLSPEGRVLIDDSR
jgi:hypothetical protein